MNNKLTLPQVVDGFMLSLHARSLSEHTIRDYNTTLAYLEEFLPKGCLFAEITGDQIKQFLASHPVSNKTLYNYHIALSALWTWAVAEGLVSEHIVKKLPRPKPEIAEIIPYTVDDVRKMLGSLTHSRVFTRKGQTRPISYGRRRSFRGLLENLAQPAHRSPLRL